MRLNTWLVVTACAILTSSCGENSTKETTVDNDTTSVTVPAPEAPATVLVDVPEPTRTAFQAKYPNATNVTWRKYEPVHTIEWDWSGWPVLDTADYAVNYTWDGTEYWAWYDENNNWIGTVSTVTDHASLPAAVNKKIQAEFPGYTITSIDKENDKNRTAYEIDLAKGEDKARVLIDENGHVMKKKTDIGGEKSKEKSM